jgi:Zn-finger nucleic acid-binding protein
MRCPLCSITLLHHTLLDSQLPAYRCARCDGIWIAANEYLRWVKTQGPALPEKQDDLGAIPTWDGAQAKLCPNCGRLLLRYRVLPNVDFQLDRCGNCNGVWFDRAEWDVIVARNLHDKVNQFFTQPWQSRLREEETRAALEALYLAKLGREDYDRARQTRDWLMNSPQRAMLLAYLQASDPYKM